MKMFACAAGVLGSALLMSGPAQAFSAKFEWGGIPLCTSGYSYLVPNPEFQLWDVPKGTAAIDFHMTDFDVPENDHGGGKVAYKGGNVIPSGLFEYYSPCPPDSAHRYMWNITALSASGEKLGKARAYKNYP